MELPLIDLLIVGAYLAAMLFLGGFFARFVKTERDYFLAGRSLPFWAIGMSIVVSDIGAIDFVSLGGQSYRYGVVAANMDWIGTMPAILLAAFVFVPYYWRAGVYSVPEFLGRRYGRGVRAWHSLAWAVYLVFNLGAVFWATARLFETLLGPAAWHPLVPPDGMGAGFAEALTGRDAAARLAVYVAVTALVTGIYTVRGGLRAVVYTDVLQLVLMFAGAGVIVWLGLKEVGGWTALRSELEAAGHRDHFTLFLPHDTTSPYPWTGVLVGLALVLAPAYFIGNQAIVQRTLGARDEWSAKAGTLFGGLLKFAIPFLVVLPGLIALAKDPSLENPDDAFATLLREILPAGLRGIVIAAFLAGLMSSVDSILTSAATIITRDLYAPVFRRGASDRHLLRAGKLCTLLLVVFGALTSPLSERFSGIYAWIQSLLAIIQGPTLALLLGGLFWKRATGAGGLTALLGGVAVSAGLTVLHKLLPEGSKPFNAEEPFFAIATISFLASAAMLVLVSLFTRPPSEEALHGLVYRSIWRDEALQEALRERTTGKGETE